MMLKRKKGDGVLWVEECMEESDIMGKEACWRVGMQGQV